MLWTVWFLLVVCVFLNIVQLHRIAYSCTLLYNLHIFLPKMLQIIKGCFDSFFYVGVGSSKAPKSRVKIMGNWENHWANVERSQWPRKTGINYLRCSLLQILCDGFVIWQKWVQVGSLISNIRIFCAWFYKVSSLLKNWKLSVAAWFLWKVHVCWLCIILLNIVNVASIHEIPVKQRKKYYKWTQHN